MTLDEDHVLHTFAMCRVWQKESTGGRSDTQKCPWRQERSAARSAPLRHPTVRTATSRRTGPASLCHPGTDDNSESCRRSVCRLRELKKQRMRRPRPRLERSLVEVTRLSCTCMRCVAVCTTLTATLAPTEQQRPARGCRHRVSLSSSLGLISLVSKNVPRWPGGLKIVIKSYIPAVWA